MTSDARKRQAELVTHNHGYDPSCVERVVGACLVTIDPEDREQVVRLVVAIVSAGGLTGGELMQAGVRIAQAALREFANPTPAKPEEPTGLGAVVEDADGERWVRVTATHGVWWARGLSRREWSNIAAVRVLSDGVQP